jgi:hypothetical protein
MAVALLALHDAMDSARRSVLVVVICTMLQLSLFTLTMALVDVTAGITISPVLVEVGAEVTVPHAIHPRLVWDIFDRPPPGWGEVVAHRLVGSAA